MTEQEAPPNADNVPTESGPAESKPTESDPAALASVDIAAGLGAVWVALVTDGGLEPWMGEGATIEPRCGGRLILPDPVGGRRRAGVVDTIEEGSELRFTWWPVTRPTERSTVTVTLEPIDSGTRVTVREAMPVSLGAMALRSEGRVSVDSAPSSAVRSARLPLHRVVPGFWAWRLAVLSVSCQMARV